MRDMTRRMSYQASHDPLTGLVNRLEFERRLEQEIQGAVFEAREHVVCYMDLDQFKIVNDTCGHIAGDALLKQLADEMRRSLRAADTLARLGGDEFGLILSGCPLPRAVEIANNLREVVSGFRFQWDNKAFMVGISIGLVAITRSSGSVTEVMSAADSACYVAKEQGRNRIHIYRPDDEIMAAHQTMMDWTPRIQSALEHGRLEIDLQEIRPIQPGLRVHYEVLVRMRGDDGERIPPMAFIPAAERYQLMSRIDRWVTNHALELMATPGHVDMHCAVNLSGQSLNDEDMLTFIVDAIDRHRVDPERLCFEITETAVVANLANARRFIQTLRGMGCRFSLDDFGSGLSSFGYLKSLPVDFLKIDGAIVRGVADDTVSAAMVAAICQLGHVMGLKMIAEFVENDVILQTVQELGVDYAQGYGIARPVAPSALRADTPARSGASD
jgi:diguanylate cyclase (GGDEF)-like protein